MANQRLFDVRIFDAATCARIVCGNEAKLLFRLGSVNSGAIVINSPTEFFSMNDDLCTAPVGVCKVDVRSIRDERFLQVFILFLRDSACVTRLKEIDV